jgi:histidine ammonia-lyase
MAHRSTPERPAGAAVSTARSQDRTASQAGTAAASRAGVPRDPQSGRPADEARPAVDPVVFGRDPIDAATVARLARAEVAPALSDDATWRRRLEAGREHLQAALAGGASVYGVSTGVGASVENAVPGPLQDAMAANLFRFHGVGTGRLLGEAEAAAVVAARLASLARGYSAVRPVVLEHLVGLLAARVLPAIPEEGSVGASGDLTPLAYVAALLAGEGEALMEGRVVSGAEGLAAAGLEALVLAPKESLALMNGTSVMAGIGAVALARAERVLDLASAVTAMTSAATLGNPEHFDERLLALKPHPGSIAVGRAIRAWLDADDAAGQEICAAGDAGADAAGCAAGTGPAATGSTPARLQDRYSVRCAPQVLGVLADAIAMARGVLDVEISGVNDNPVVDPDTGAILHGGNFYGGHLVFALDGLKAGLAAAADLLDRQLVLLCLPETSGGLAANLVARGDDDRVAHHGFKAMQITASALAAEAAKTSLPTAVFSRSTESHNQDKVSMGTIAAREARRTAELAETVGAITLLGACQAVDLRLEAGGDVPSALSGLHAAVRNEIAAVVEDRRQDHDIARVLELLARGQLPLIAVHAVAGVDGRGGSGDGGPEPAEDS